MQRRVFLATVLALTIVSPAISREAVSKDRAALTFIETYRIGENLSDLARQTGATTRTFQMIERTVGPKQARQMFQDRLRKEVPNFQGQWNRALAKVYAGHFSATELRSLGTERNRSAFYVKFKSLEPALATEMKSAGIPILTALLQRILVSMVNEVSSKSR